MKLLVTGANGFLGRHVVAECLRRGHSVRALVRPAASVDGLAKADGVELFRTDLRRPATNLGDAFQGVDALIHLAADVTGNEESQFASTVIGTEKLLNVMARTGVRRIVLASSCSVYDWRHIRGTITEESPIGGDIYQRDGYAIAKYWQERLARRLAEEHGWQLTVMRPGFIWGREANYFSGIGQRIGKIHVLMAPGAHPILTHVSNTADCFLTALEQPGAIGETFNVFDGMPVSTWRYVGEYMRRTGDWGTRIPIPYWASYAICRTAYSSAKLVFGPRTKLPGLFMPLRFEARFKPLRYSTQKLRDILNWTPKYSWDQCLKMTYGDVK